MSGAPLTDFERGILTLLAHQHEAALKCRRNHANWAKQTSDPHPAIPITIAIAQEDMPLYRGLCSRNLLAIAHTGHGYAVMAMDETFAAAGLTRRENLFPREICIPP